MARLDDVPQDIIKFFKMMKTYHDEARFACHHPRLLRMASWAP